MDETKWVCVPEVPTHDMIAASTLSVPLDHFPLKLAAEKRGRAIAYAISAAPQSHVAAPRELLERISKYVEASNDLDLVKIQAELRALLAKG